MGMGNKDCYVGDEAQSKRGGSRNSSFHEQNHREQSKSLGSLSVSLSVLSVSLSVSWEQLVEGRQSSFFSRLRANTDSLPFALIE